MRRASWLAVVVAAALGACGGADDAGTTDGGGGDAGVFCQSSVSLAPMMPTAPAVIVATGSISGPASGQNGFEWSVRKEGDPSFDPMAMGDGTSTLTVSAPTDGLYTVTLFGDRGGTTCSSGSAQVNVLDDGAGSAFYRLRVVPGPSLGAPIQEHVRQVSGSTSTTFSVGGIALDSGFHIVGELRDSSNAPVAAYLRFTGIGDIDPMATETFSSALGVYDVRLGAGTYDVLMVPQDNSLAPVELTGIAVNNLSGLFVTPASPINGSVLDPSGAAIMGATVSLRIDGVPTTIATTDPAGAFSVLGHVGGTTTIHVVPPASSGLPTLDLDASANLVAAEGEALAIQYASTLTSRTLSAPVRMKDGVTPAPDARVTFVARSLAGAGSVSPGGAAALPMRGSRRATAVADGAGDLPPTPLPDAIYDVIVEPAAGAPAAEGVSLAMVDLQLAMPNPPMISLASWATISGAAIDGAALGLDAIRVTAIPTGLLAGTTTAAASATTDNGAYALLVAGGGSYDLVFDASDYAQARARLTVQAGAAGQTTTAPSVEMPDALEVTGSIELGGNGIAGVSITLLCYECAGAMEASLPVAEAVSELDGSFSLAVPNPGVSQ